MATTSTAARTIPQDLLDGIRNGDDAAIERGFRAIFPSLVVEATQLAESPAAAGPIIGKAFLKVASSGKSIGSMEALDAALHAAIHEAAVRDKSRRAAVHRFEHNEGVAAHASGSAPLTNVTLDADQIWSRVKPGLESLRNPAKASVADGHRTAAHMAGAIDRKNKALIPIIVGGIVVVAIGVYLVSKIDRTPRESDITTALLSADGQTLTAGDGQIGRISLSDETGVVLGSGSKLRVPHNLATWRAVGLNGAASFTVPAGSRPFELRGNRIAATMTSGTIDVFADSLAATTVVRITNGSAKLKSGDSTWIAPQGKAYVIETGPKIREASLEDLTDAFSWISGRFSARGKVSDIVLKMSHWYGQEVGIGDAKIADREGIATGPLDSLRATIATLEKSAKVKLSGVNGKWILFPAGK